MSKIKKPAGPVCGSEDAASIAAASLLRYFTDNKWKIISFFPNASCIGKECPCKKQPKKKSH